MLYAALVVIGLLGFQDPPPPAPAPAQPTSSAAPQAPQTTSARLQRICEQRAPTGRRLEQRVCYSPERYAEIMAAKRKEAEELTTGGNVQNDTRANGG